MCGINPQAYLADVLNRIADTRSAKSTPCSPGVGQNSNAYQGPPTDQRPRPTADGYDQALRTLDECGQDIGGQRVDREHVRQTVRGSALAFPKADGGIVNDRIETAEPVDLRRHIPGARDRLQITDHDRFSLRQRAPGVVRACSVARVKYDLVALFGKKLPGHQAKPGG